MVSGLQKKNKVKQKEPFKIAKSPGQLALGIIIFGIFICKSGYDLFAYIKSQNDMKNSVAQVETPSAQNPQSGLESLAQDPTGANVQEDANDIYQQTLDLQGNKPGKSPAQEPIAAVPPAGRAKVQVAADDVDIMSSKNPSKRSGKTITVSVAEGGRVNPFLPEGENIFAGSSSLSLNYPPEQLVTDSDASKVMATTISGILYDKYSPSAIVNFGGNDYLVKRGDIINKYKVLGIYKDQVVVQLGKNTYRAGVGQLLQQDKVNYNTIANLEKKFGGNNVTINVKKKGY